MNIHERIKKSLNNLSKTELVDLVEDLQGKLYEVEDLLDTAVSDLAAATEGKQVVIAAPSFDMKLEIQALLLAEAETPEDLERLA